MELGGRHVHRDADVARPFGRIDACLLQHPPAEGHDQAGLLGDRVNFADQTKRTQVQIHLTNRCNLRCVHCYMDSGVKVVPETETGLYRQIAAALATGNEAAAYVPISSRRRLASG